MSSFLLTQWRFLATAIMFLTRIPVGNSGSGDANDLAASTQYFPLVGVIVGIGAGLVFWVAQLLWSSEIAVVLCIAGGVLLTGGFHEDGLADVADSAGAWTKQKKLDIMRDSRIGTYGGLALVLALLLSAASLIDIADNTSNQVTVIVSSLVLAHVLGRWSSLILIYTTHYARDDAANKVFVDGVNTQRLLVGTVTTLLVIIAAMWFLTFSALIVIPVCLACLSLSRWWFIKKIGGITGDCLGAANKLTEISVYLSIAATLP